MNDKLKDRRRAAPGRVRVVKKAAKGARARVIAKSAGVRVRKAKTVVKLTIKGGKPTKAFKKTAPRSAIDEYFEVIGFSRDDRDALKSQMRAAFQELDASTF